MGIGHATNFESAWIMVSSRGSQDLQNVQNVGIQESRAVEMMKTKEIIFGGSEILSLLGTQSMPAPSTGDLGASEEVESTEPEPNLELMPKLHFTIRRSNN